MRRFQEILEPLPGRSTPVQTVLDCEVKYFQNHREHIHYQAVAKAGVPIGSGAVESLCGQLQGRLHARGQFWERPDLTHLLRLMVLVRNHDGLHLWN